MEPSSTKTNNDDGDDGNVKKCRYVRLSLKFAESDQQSKKEKDCSECDAARLICAECDGPLSLCLNHLPDQSYCDACGNVFCSDCDEVG